MTVKGLYTKEDRQYIIDNPHLTTKEIAMRLNRSVNSVYDQRRKYTPNFKRDGNNRKKRKPCAFKYTIPFLKENNFKTAAEAIKHYGSIRDFRKAVKEFNF